MPKTDLMFQGKRNFSATPGKIPILAIAGMLLMLLIFRQSYINPPKTVIEVGCSNECAFGYNQAKFPDCQCALMDSDDDSYYDLEEIKAGTNPLDPTDYPDIR